MTSTLIGSSSGLNAPLNAPTIHHLPNGLTIVAEQMPVDAVNLSLWVGIGSAIETDEINGMAHFLEHMIFKGTRRLPSGVFEREVEQRGAATNAATSQDYTYYYITAAPQDFAALAPLQIEVVLNAAIPDDAFERERSVVLEEIRRSDDNPRRRTYARSIEAGFDRLPYRRPVLGPASVIENLKPQQMLMAGRRCLSCLYPSLQSPRTGSPGSAVGASVARQKRTRGRSRLSARCRRSAARLVLILHSGRDLHSERVGKARI